MYTVVLHRLEVLSDIGVACLTAPESHDWSSLSASHTSATRMDQMPSRTAISRHAWSPTMLILVPKFFSSMQIQVRSGTRLPSGAVDIYKYAHSICVLLALLALPPIRRRCWL